MNGIMRRRGRVLERLLHDGDQPVLVRVAQPARDRVVFGACARTPETAAHGGDLGLLKLVGRLQSGGDP